jgi:hypothetical protein
MKLVMLIKMCINYSDNKVWVGKNLSYMFPIRNGSKRGDALLPSFVNCALQHVIRRAQVIQDGLKLNGKLQLLF